jgi:trans-aconitate 2-methyltransferase
MYDKNNSNMIKHIWNPDQYLKYESQRNRPAVDLLARIEIKSPEIVFDLGCGPGNSTRLLVDRWRQARITGIDNSLEMLKRAAQDLPGPNWIEANLQTWSPNYQADLLYSNAALHWLDDHAKLLPRLTDYLNPGGVLAIQMPGNYAFPSHLLILDAAKPWMDKIGQRIRADPVEKLSFYYDMLTPIFSHLDIWETVYIQELKGENAVAEWLKGSALKPLIDLLDKEEAESFFNDYSSLAQKAYPQRTDGITLYPFRRVFIVAKK